MNSKLATVSILLLAGLGGCLSGTPDQGATRLEQGAAILKVDGVKTIAHDTQGNVRWALGDAPNAPQMVQRLVNDESTAEPVLAFTPAGEILYTIRLRPTPPTSEADDVLLRSGDGGLTWEDATPAKFPDYRFFEGDAIIVRDDVSDRVFYTNLDLETIAGGQTGVKQVCTALHNSDDSGRTWIRHDGICQESGSSNDHETIFTGKAPAGSPSPTATYFCALGPYCRVTYDDGATWGPEIQSFQTSAECGRGQHGHGRASAVSGIAVVGSAECDVPVVAISHDFGKSWKTHVVDETAGSAGDDTFGHEAAVALDAEDNIYVFWLGEDNLPRLAVSPDVGETWSSPMKVSPPSVTYAATMLIAVAAGDVGRVSFLYIGTTIPSPSEAGDDEWNATTWDAYVGYIFDVFQPVPVVTTTLANPVDDPVHRGRCEGWASCSLPDQGPPRPMGVAGIPEHAMLHYLGMDMNPIDGRVAAAFLDLCVGECVTAERYGTYPSVSRAAVGLQIGGESLLPLLD